MAWGREGVCGADDFKASLVSFYDYRFVKCTYSVWSGIRLEQGVRSTSIGFMSSYFTDMFLDCEESADVGSHRGTHPVNGFRVYSARGKAL